MGCRRLDDRVLEKGERGTTAVYTVSSIDVGIDLELYLELIRADELSRSCCSRYKGEKDETR